MVASAFVSVAVASLPRVFGVVGRLRVGAVSPPSATSLPLVEQRQLDRWVRARVVDEAFARYLDWRAESDAVDPAFDVWSRASRSDGATPYAAYTAALDREERAASAYRSVIDRFDELFGGEDHLVGAEARAARA